MGKYISSKFKIIMAMLIWGTIGIFVKNINLSSIEIAFFRAFIGSVVLLLIAILNKEIINKEVLKQNAVVLSLSGIALGINWATLFQAMKYTTISNATLSYYFAPIFMIVFSAIIFKEKMSIKSVICMLVALMGLFLILKSGDDKSLDSYNHTKGIIFGLCGAVLYAIIVILNKFIKDLSPIQITLSQLFISTVVLLPIVLRGGMGSLKGIDINTWTLIVILGIIHTGFAYLLYFPSLKDVKAQSVAIISYLDPISAILISAIFLKEPMTTMQLIGGVLILSSAYINEKK